MFAAVLAGDYTWAEDAAEPAVTVRFVSAGEETVITTTISLSLSDVSGLSSNQEMLDAYVEEILYGNSGIMLMADYGEDVLNGKEYTLYSVLKTEIKQIAAGEIPSTEIDLSNVDISWSWTWEELNVTSDDDTAAIQEAVNVAFAKEEFDQSKVFQYVTRDCPYDMYWADVTGSVIFSFSCKWDSEGVTYEITQVKIPVAEDYSAGEYEVDVAEVNRAKTARECAEEIVDKYANLTDYEKLVAFKDEICALTSYNYDAADDDTTPYGDPWQLIYVFDGDESTTVVCEGYAKAFQYLCDLSGFDDCYTVTGTMSGGTGAGGHMWNVVHLNGVVYMADVTNSDTGTVGQNGGLFLVNADDTIEGTNSSLGYLFLVGNTTVTYKYDDDTIALYSAGVRTLTGKTYSLDDAEVTVSGTYTYDGTAQIPSASDIAVTLDGETLSSSNYMVSVSNNTNAGTATVTVAGIGSYSGSTTGSFTIVPAELTVTGATAASRDYDGTDAVTVTAVTLDGVIDGDKDNVDVDVTDLTGTVESADAGSYTKVTITETMSLTGTVAGNYILTQPTAAVPADVTISAKTVSSPTIVLSQDTYEYDGTAKEPTVTVKDGTTEIPSSEYTVSYTDNVEAGTATVTITDVTGGNYTVSGSITFAITSASLTGAVVTVSGTYTYNGTEQIPSASDIAVTLNGETVSLSNYTVSVTNNTNAGTATVTVTGTGSYSGSATGSFTIVQAELTVTGATATSREYDGTNVVAVTGVTLDGVIRTDAVSVDVTGLTGTVGSADAGSYTEVTLSAENALQLTGTAAGNYTLTQPTAAVSANVTISAKTVSSPTIELSQDTYEYDGTAKKPTVTVKDGMTEIPSSEYTVSYTDNVEAGTATVTITDVTGGNYTVSGSITFAITSASLTGAVVTVSGTYTYNGTEQIPSASAIAVTLNGETVSSSNYTVSVSNNTNAGTATGTVTGTGSYSSSATGSFTIDQRTAELTWTTLTAAELVYDGSAKTLSASVSNKAVESDDVSVTVALTGDNRNVTADGFYYTATGLAGEDSGNYKLPEATADGIQSPVYFIIDQNAPTGSITIGENTWDTFRSMVTFGLFFNETQTVTVSVGDSDSAVKTEYYLANAAVGSMDELADVEWTAFTGSFVIAPENRYVVYVRITDSLGSSTVINSDGIVLDGTAPAITGLEDGKTYCASVTFTVSDDNLDRAELDGKVLAANEDGSYTILADNGKHTVQAIDRAGNASAVYEITVNDGHTMTYHEKVEATATKSGTVEYWHCEACGGNFADSEGKEEVTDLTIPATGDTSSRGTSSGGTSSGGTSSGGTSSGIWKHGLVLDTDDVFRYYQNNVFAKDYVGVVPYDGSLFFIKNGLVDLGANGLCLYKDVWYFVSLGQVQLQYTELAMYDSAWFYITDGILDTSKNGFVLYNGGKFLVVAGKLLLSYNGLWLYASSIGGDGCWYFLAVGMVQNVSRVVMYRGEWFVIADGRLDTDYNGIITYDGAEFTVVNGQLYS